jgi:glutaminyl-tRNA synthetase
MPPKFDPSNPQTAALIDSFAKLGLSSTIATETARNAKSAAALSALIAECGLDNGSSYDDKQAALFVKVATGAGKVGPEERRFLVEKVVSGDLKSSEQLTGEFGSDLSGVLTGTAAIKFVETNPASTPINEEEFATACGVGESFDQLMEACTDNCQALKYQPSPFPSS